MFVRRSGTVWNLVAGLVIGGFAIGLAVADDTVSQQDQKDHKDHKDHKDQKDHKDHKHDHGKMKVEKKIADTLKKLSPADRKLATAQRFCPMMPYSRLGADGAPLKVKVAGKPVFVCCKGCVKSAAKDAKATLAKTSKLTKASAVLAKLPAKDREAAEAQKFCAVAKGSFLGTMGAPVKLNLNGKTAFVCCKRCTAKAKANPAATLAQVEKLKKAGQHGGHHGDHKHDDHKHDDDKHDDKHGDHKHGDEKTKK